jgi:hypothetical protein
MKASNLSSIEHRFKKFYTPKQLDVIAKLALKHGIEENKIRQMLLIHGIFCEEVFKEEKESIFVPNFGKFISKIDYLNANNKPIPDKLKNKLFPNGEEQDSSKDQGYSLDNNSD